MALTDDEKKEMRQTMAEGIAEGLALFRSRTEEEEAKREAADKDSKDKKPEGGNSDTNRGVTLSGFLLGER